MKKLLKDKKISEDEERKALDEIQKMTATGIQKIDQAAKTRKRDPRDQVTAIVWRRPPILRGSTRFDSACSVRRRSHFDGEFTHSACLP